MQAPTTMEPKRPTHLSDHARICLEALARQGLGDQISLGNALGLLHYLDYRPTHDVDAWWNPSATEQQQQKVISVVEHILQPFGQVRVRTWGDVLAQGDLAALTLTARRTVGNDIAHIRETEEHFLPYRGSMHDIGGTLTHKVEVIRLFEAGHLEPEICRLLPIVHDLPAVENDVQSYKNVMKLLDGSFAPSEVSGILYMDRRLVQAYVDIVDEHHPEILANNPYCQQRPGCGHTHSTQGS